MKQFYLKSLLITLCVMNYLPSFSLTDYDCKVDGICYKLNQTEKTASVTYNDKREVGYLSYNYNYYTQYSGEIILPSSISYQGNTYNVTSIGEHAFTSCGNLTSIIMPNSVTNIDLYAFCGCSSLNTIKMSSSIKTIGRFVFDGCTSLTKVIIPDIATWCKITYYGYSYEAPYSSNPLYYAHHLYSDENTEITELVIPDGVESISDCAFVGCSSLTSVSLPNSVISIGYDVFSGCSSLTAPVFNSNVFAKLPDSFIGEYSIPEGISYIASCAFSRCSNLETIKIPNSVSSIGYNAFAGCNNLKKVIINDIAAWCNILFEYYKGDWYEATTPLHCATLYLNDTLLTNLEIPEGVITINRAAFWKCKNIVSVSIPNSLRSIHSLAFEGCDNIETVTLNNDSILSVQQKNNESVLSFLCIPSNPKKVIIGDSVRTIGVCAFRNCGSIETIRMGTRVQEIGNNAFNGCTSLKKVVIPDLSAWCKVNLADKSSTPLIVAHHLYTDEETELTELVIPEGVTSIGNYSFGSCMNLTSITIPESVTSIGNYSFYECMNLTSITIPESVTSIGNYAFCDCSRLTSITIPCNVTEIGYGAFCPSLAGGDWLRKVILNSNYITSVNRSEYSSENRLLSSIFGKAVSEYILGDSIITIGNQAFMGCNALTSITISNSVTSIGANAFRGSGLTSITVGNGVTTIGDYAFRDCYGLQKVIIPDIAAWCKINFGYDSNPLIHAHHLYADEETEITDLEIPNSVTSICWAAFSGCSGLTSITIPTSVTSIGGSAFRDCTGLTSIIIPTSVNSIGGSAFEDCTSLEEVIVPDNVDDIGFGAFDKSTKLYVNSNTISLINLWQCELIPYQVGTNDQLKPPFMTVLSKTQTTAVLKLNSDYTVYKYYIDYGYPDKTLFSNNELELTNLVPNTEYRKQLTVILEKGDKTYFYNRSSPVTFTTESLLPRIEFSNTATSYSVHGLYTEGDAHVVKEDMAICYKKRYTENNIIEESLQPFWCDIKSRNYYNGEYYYYFVANGTEEVEGNTLSLYHLDPNTQIVDSCIVYRIIIEFKDGTRDSTFGCFIYPQTAPLQLSTLTPKVISTGNVIVSAESNIDDEETNVGFEWRRMDWTDEFPSRTGGAALYDGIMEGYIRNLNTDKLWKCRPYYLSDSGNYYYGDWIGIDPTDFSYFEPTVHTYANISVDGNTALVKGYALQGTDGIKVQGFVYWRDVAESRKDGAANIPSNAITVEASGQVMTAALTGLEYETNYCYAAFVTTNEGETFYGEQQMFSTGANPSNIEAVGINSPDEVTVAYYDINGRRIPTLQPGLNIVRMSNGKVKKVMVK